jgi:hypothetical protein
VTKSYKSDGESDEELESDKDCRIVRGEKSEER